MNRLIQALAATVVLTMAAACTHKEAAPPPAPSPVSAVSPVPPQAPPAAAPQPPSAAAPAPQPLSVAPGPLPRVGAVVPAPTGEGVAAPGAPYVWGAPDAAGVWHDTAWWWQNQPAWVRAHHPEWWGDFYQGTWYPASWWYQYDPQWAQLYHPEWWGDYYQGSGTQRRGGGRTNQAGSASIIRNGGATFTRASGIPPCGGG